MVPGRLHDLWPASNTVNAPRLVRDVAGDFSIEVKVAHIDRETQSAPGANIAYRGAGLLFWQDNDHLVRYERAVTPNGEGQATYLFFTKVENGRETKLGTS